MSEASVSVAFGYKTAWLAIPADPAELAQAFGLLRIRSVDWADAVNEIIDREGIPATVVLLPPVEGWTLAVLGSGELFDDDGMGYGRLDLGALSSQFGEAQKFATHRVVEYHEWQRWVQGSPVRRYCWIGESGEVRFDEGAPEPAEGNVVRGNATSDDWECCNAPDEDVVLAVAEAWSVNPLTLQHRNDLPDIGLRGSL